MKPPLIDHVNENKSRIKQEDSKGFFVILKESYFHNKLARVKLN